MSPRTAALSILICLCFAFCAPAFADQPKPLLAVLAKAQDKLCFVDPDAMKIIATVPTGHGPHEVTISADGKTAFVGNYGDQTPGNSISVIDVESRKETKRIDLAPLHRPHGIAELDGKLYFTSETSCCVARIDLKTAKIDWIMGTGQAGTHMLAIDAADGRIYTTNIGGGGVSEMDLPATDADAATKGPPPSVLTIPVEGQPEGTALSPDGKELWAAGRANGVISIIDTASGTVRQTIHRGGLPIRLAFTPDGRRVLVSAAQAGEVVVFDAATKKEERRIAVGQTPIGIVVAPDSGRAFVSTQGGGKVTAIDLAKLEKTGEVAGIEGPDGITWVAPRAANPAAEARAKRKAGMLGVAVAPLDDNARQQLNLDNKIEGLVVAQVGPDTPAATAGLKEGDVITAVNGAKSADPQAFQRLIRRARAGDEVTFDVLREGKTEQLKATLAERPG
jgi:YVTN family beta-propeller protein